MNKSRKANTIKNMVVGVVGQFLVVIMQFACRTVFVRTLAADYLGINGIFLNVISILSLSELGFGTALLYSMYKPIANNDTTKIVHILNLFRRVYCIIAVVISIMAVLCIPFLKYIVGREIYEAYNIIGIYILFVINSVVSYLMVYKKSLIQANQQGYICSVYEKSATIIVNIVQIIFLITTHNFYIYIVLQIISNIVTNVLLSNKANKMYPYLLKNDHKLPHVQERKAIYINTKAFALQKLGAVLVCNTDNLFMSYYIGVMTVGMYSNYLLFVSNIGVFLGVMINSFSASVGNMGAIENSEKSREIFNRLQFVSFWLYSLCAICLINLLNPFIKVWIGEKYLLPQGIVYLVILLFYIAGLRRITGMFIECYGIADDTKYKTIIEAIINLTVSYILVKRIGLIGIFIGTLVADFSVIWREVLSVYRNIFHCSVKEFYKNYIKYFLFFIVTSVITVWVNSFIPEISYGYCVIKLVIVMCLYHIIFIITFMRDPNFKESLSIVSMINKKINIKKHYNNVKERLM